MTQLCRPAIGGKERPRLPTAFWMLWAAYLINRLTLTAPSFLSLYLATQHLASAPQIALAISINGAGQVIAGLAGGSLSDRIGARRTIIFSQSAAIASSLGLWAARDPLLICGLLLTSGILTGLPRSAPFTIVTRLAEQQHRVRAFGHLYWANNIGSSLSSLIAGALLQIYPSGLFILSAAGAACYAVLASRLPPMPPAPMRCPSGNPLADIAHDLLYPFTQRSMAAFLALSFACSCIYMQKQGALPLDMHAHGLDPPRIGIVLAVNAIVVIALQPLLSPALARLPRTNVFIVASLLMGAGFGANALVHSMNGYVALVVVWSIAEIMLVPTSAAYIADHAPDGRTGSYQGAYSFAWNSGLAIGSPAGQLLSTAAGSTALWACMLALGAGTASGHAILGRNCRKPPRASLD